MDGHIAGADVCLGAPGTWYQGGKLVQPCLHCVRSLLLWYQFLPKTSVTECQSRAKMEQRQT